MHMGQYVCLKRCMRNEPPKVHVRYGRNCMSIISPDHENMVSYIRPGDSHAVRFKRPIPDFPSPIIVLFG